MSSREGDKMTEHLMTAQELAEFRAWLNRRAPYPDDEEFLPVRVSSLHGLLATVDALTARIYELEDLLPSAIVTAERDTYAEQLAEALALLGEHREALGWIAQQACEYQVGDGEVCLMTSNCVTEWCLPCYAKQSLTLTAPEALRQQQEREAEKDALIERLQNWLERFGEHSDRCDVLLLDDQGRHQACSCGFDAIAYNLTPPEALREREERMGALEKVYQALSDRWALRWHEATTEQEQAEVAALSAVAALDAVKGGR